MTTLLSWVSVDSRGPSALYIVSDSRITWGSQAKCWDSGRKLFACQSADIFGYSGDVLFPSLALGQIGDLIDHGLLWDESADARTRHSVLFQYLRCSFSRRHATPDQDFSIIHGARDGKDLKSNYSVWCIRYNAKKRTWNDFEIFFDAPGNSQVLCALGSGHRVLKQEIRRWAESPQGGTARSIFSAFCDALASKRDPLSGGVPQIVTLGRKDGGKIAGFVADGICYLYGLPIEPNPALEKIEWYDDLFTRISPLTLKRLSNAQRHTRVGLPKARN